MADLLRDIVTGTAGNTISSAINVPLIQRLIQDIDDVRRLDENRQLLGEQLNRIKGLLLDIRSLIRDQQREVPGSLNNSLLRMQREVGKGKELIYRSKRTCSLNNSLLRMQREVGKGKELIYRSKRTWQEQCIDYLLNFQPVSTQIREWNTTMNGLLNELSTDFLLICNAQQIVCTAPQQEGVLLQDQPDTGLIGMEYNAAETRLQNWVSEAPHVRIIAVYGMGGVGKTTLLKKVHNNFKVGSIFDHVIWVTVSRFPVLQMQNDIASGINLDLVNCSADMWKMKLSQCMKTKKFFLVLDDMWSPLDLKELGVEFGENKGSKVVFTTRNRDLVREMNAKEAMQIQPLLPEEGWELFWKIAFEDGHVEENIENIARLVAKECQGLPLAINVIASTMLGSTDVDEWKFALKQMQKVDPNFPLTHPRIDRDLYQRLKLSYDRLPDANLKNCFLYCGMYREDASIPVEVMVQMWIVEGFISKTREDAEYEYLLATGKSYVKFLQNRSLLGGYDSGGKSFVIVHDVVRDMAIYIGENEENCVLMAGQSLQHFPDIPDSDNCKRISVYYNDMETLPTKELRCPKLVSLLLGANPRLKEIPEAFFLNFTSLDLKKLPIKSLPTSLWQLTQLEFLCLFGTEIEDICKEIGNLSNLQFLHLRYCSNLKSLPSQIGELKNLKYLDISGCNHLRVIPLEITKLSNCKIVRER